jgi:hypothetical protein
VSRARIIPGVGLAVAGLLLQACATAKPVVYGPIGPEAPHGYKDLKNQDGGYTVLIAMPGGASTAELRGFFDRRATELCPGGVDRTNVFRIYVNEQTYLPYNAYGPSVASRVRAGVELEGYVYCKAGAEPPAAGNPAS